MSSWLAILCTVGFYGKIVSTNRDFGEYEDVIAAAAFVGALDATFMNVSMSQVVIDLDTTVGTIQKMVSFYTLITASLLLISARLQDIIGKREIFLLGMIICGVGDLIAALSPNAMVLDKNTKLCVLLVAVSIAAFLAFEIFELRYSEAGKAPLFDVRLLKNRNLRN